jgi:hypothetical protein
MVTIDDAPAELALAIKEFWPESEWNNAAAIAQLESGWSAFAVVDTRITTRPCGAIIRIDPSGVRVSAEYSIGWFQINACNLPPDWVSENLYNTRHNCGTAHAMWAERGWSPWYFSARILGLL